MAALQAELATAQQQATESATQLEAAHLAAREETDAASTRLAALGSELADAQAALAASQQLATQRGTELEDKATAISRLEEQLAQVN